jgi:hypothetical protein
LSLSCGFEFSAETPDPTDFAKIVKADVAV